MTHRGRTRLRTTIGLSLAVAVTAIAPSVVAAPATSALPVTGIAVTASQHTATAAGTLPVSLPPILPPQPLGGGFGQPSNPPAPVQINLDAAHPGGPIAAGARGIDEFGSLGQGIWDPNARQVFPAAMPTIQRLASGLVRMEPQVNVDAGCHPSPLTSCSTYLWKQHTNGAVPGLLRDGEMGPDDYMAMLASVAPSAPPFIVVNIEGDTVSDAADWVAYMNGSVTSSDPRVRGWAQLRMQNRGGDPTPYNVRYWEIGNEEYRLRPTSVMDNPLGCNDGQSGVVEQDFGVMYGCLVSTYSMAMKAVDASINIVADVEGSNEFTRGLMTGAGTSFDDVDTHEYEQPTDSGDTTFDSDGQVAAYSVQVTTAAPVTTYALWLNGRDPQGPPAVNVYVDGIRTPTYAPAGGPDVVDSRVRTDSSSNNPEPLVIHAPLLTGHHTLRVVACSGASLDTAGVCLTHDASDGSLQHHFVVNLRHITLEPPDATATDLASQQQSVGCFAPDAGTLVDTRVSRSSGRTGTGPSDPGVPWRLDDPDFAAAMSTGAYAHESFALGPSPYATRGPLSTRPNVGVFVGELAMFGGCDQQPGDLNETHLAGLTSVLESIAALANADGVNPIVGEAAYQLNLYDPHPTMNLCEGWAVVRNVGCLGQNRDGTSYLTGVGEDLLLLASLAGNRIPVSLAGVPVANTGRSGGVAPATSVPMVTAIAYQDGTTTRVLVVNMQPGAGVSVQIGGTAVTTASATTVSGAPYADNSDASQSAVHTAALAVSVSGGTAALTLPPFSCTLVTLG